MCVCVNTRVYTDTHTLRATQANARWSEVGKTYPHPIPSLGRGKPVWGGMG